MRWEPRIGESVLVIAAIYNCMPRGTVGTVTAYLPDVSGRHDWDCWRVETDTESRLFRLNEIGPIEEKPT